jgi:hypothetical protein
MAYEEKNRTAFLLELDQSSPTVEQKTALEGGSMLGLKPQAVNALRHSD